MTNYKNPVCRGSYMLGTACGSCERCRENYPAWVEAPKPKKDTGYKKLQRERDEYFTKWGEYMKRANAAEERIKQLEDLLGECEDLLKIAEKNLFFEGSDVYESRITSVLGKLRAAKEGINASR